MSTHSWQPNTSMAMLRRRGQLFTKVHSFFAQRRVLQVDTPLLSWYTASEPHSDAIHAYFQADGSSDQQTLYLMSSPEYAMKRLLAAGSGCIYQITKAFRNGEIGHFHNPEFTMLEWYRVGFDLHTLMKEVVQLLDILLLPKGRDLQWHYWSYKKAFAHTLSCNPFDMTDKEVKHMAVQHVNLVMNEEAPRDVWLDLLMSHCVQPNLPEACCVFAYPASQAALSRVTKDQWGYWIAQRFEVYVKGLEIANGYHELTDAQEQARRFAADNKMRAAMGKATIPPDQRLIAALQSGLPDCAGVAMGLDRLLMLAHDKSDIAEVMPFHFANA